MKDHSGSHKLWERRTAGTNGVPSHRTRHTYSDQCLHTKIGILPNLLSTLTQYFAFNLDLTNFHRPKCWSTFPHSIKNAQDNLETLIDNLKKHILRNSSRIEWSLRQRHTSSQTPLDLDACPFQRQSRHDSGHHWPPFWYLPPEQWKNDDEPPSEMGEVGWCLIVWTLVPQDALVYEAGSTEIASETSKCYCATTGFCTSTIPVARQDCLGCSTSTGRPQKQ